MIDLLILIEKYMSFTINNKLSFIDSFQFISSSLDSLAKNQSKFDFKYFSQKFDNNKLDLFDVYRSLTDRKISDKEYEHALNVWNKFEMKTMKYNQIMDSV